MANTSLAISDTSLTPQIIMEEGAGKAYQSVAQSSALAIQDAVDNLRNINTIAATVLGVAMAQALENPPAAMQFQPVIKMAEDMATAAAANFANIGKNASDILKNFPSGGA